MIELLGATPTCQTGSISFERDKVSAQTPMPLGKILSPEKAQEIDSHSQFEIDKAISAGDYLSISCPHFALARDRGRTESPVSTLSLEEAEFAALVPSGHVPVGDFPRVWESDND